MEKLQSERGKRNRCPDMEPFCFKRFSVSHTRSAMRVGVDGVLIGAWADVSGMSETGEALDAGCGCGLIALMLAQRCGGLRVTGVDCHEPSVTEATANVASSPWPDRIRILHKDVTELTEKDFNGPVGLIVSNPPFFVSGIIHPDTPRLMARHAGEFGPLTLIALGAGLLSSHGRLTMIVPASMEQEVRAEGDAHGMAARRICRVTTVAGKQPSRVMMELVRDEVSEVKEQSLVIHHSDHTYTEEYRELTRDFYLRF